MAMFIQAEVSEKGHWPNVEVYSVKDFKNMSPSHKRLQRRKAVVFCWCKGVPWRSTLDMDLSILTDILTSLQVNEPLS